MDLSKIVDMYKARTIDEDIEEIKKHGGIIGLQSALISDPRIGLTTADDFSLRIELFDTNLRKERESISFLELCLDAMKDFTMILLLVLGVLSLIIGATVGNHPEHDWIDGFAIIIAVIIVVLVTATNDY